jgi:ArsR family transcriptional regulator, nickel/cobalt-responsive transcriptional repressor
MTKDDSLSSKKCADQLRALADADRLRIIALLRGGEKNVSQLTSELEKSIAMVSHHLQILKHQGIVETEKQGRFVVYRLHPKVFTDAYSLDLGCCKFKFTRGAAHP